MSSKLLQNVNQDRISVRAVVEILANGARETGVRARRDDDRRYDFINWVDSPACSSEVTIS